MKRTKIISTIGPSSSNPEILKKLFENGSNIFRLNFSHGTHEEHQEKINTIKSLDLPIPIMLDTKGPEVRTGEVKNDFTLNIGDKITLTTEKGIYEEIGKLSVSYPQFINDIEIGSILTFDSIMQVEVKKIEKNDIFCEVIKGKGRISSKRHINLMGRHVSLPTLTEKDWLDIDFGIENKLEFIALSFCRKGDDIVQLREYCAKKGHIPHIIAKIENQEAIDNLEEIVIESDGIMVARGDLADEINFARVPLIQKEIIELCKFYTKPVIVATQMLVSMVENIKPTRSEISDVSNAVFQGVDATMTSEETAKGLDPVNVISTMSEIIKVSEEEILLENDTDIEIDATIALARNAIQAIKYTEEIDAIVVITKSGLLARHLSVENPKLPIYAFTDTQLSSNQMQLINNVYPFAIDFDKDNYENTIKNIEEILKEKTGHEVGKYLLFSYSKINNKEYPLITIRDLDY